MRLLLTEDHPKLGPVLAAWLRREGHVVELVTDGRDALDRITHETFDAVILDLMLPGMDGLQVLDSVRSRGDMTPVLVLTARDEVTDRVLGLDTGADDYLSKPFEFDELLARLRSIVRRANNSGGSAVIRVRDVEIDTRGKQVRRAGQTVRLSAREYAVLECLAVRKDRVVSREDLLATVYEGDEQPNSNVVEVFVGALRKKLDHDAEHPLIHTRRGLGYLLSDKP